MIRTIIIDDEKNAIKALEVALTDFCPQIEIVGMACSPLEGIKEIQLKNPDLVFVDIEMPTMSGIELIEQFVNRKFEVIFVTAYNQYAVKAFKVCATDYLLKPLNIMELINAVRKITDRKEKPEEAWPDLQTEKLKMALSGKLSLPTANGSEYINIKDIIRIEADGSYSKVFTNDKKMRLVTKNLKSFEESLEGESFFRIHKSHMINIEHIKKYSPVKDGGTIEMADESEIPVARSVKTALAELINKYAR
jgi:two-component system, LytTR family, response regulator